MHIRILAIYTVVFSCFFLGCKENKRAISFEKNRQEEVKKTQKEYEEMKTYTSSGKFLLTNKEPNQEITYTFVRQANKQLPVVSYKETTYIANEIKLIVTQGEKTLGEYTFTKETFASILPASYLSEGILTNFLFAKVEQQKMQFIATISFPQKESEEYFPILIFIYKDGSYSFTKGTVEDIEFPSQAIE